jgi:hypothetical protein
MRVGFIAAAYVVALAVACSSDDGTPGAEAPAPGTSAASASAGPASPKPAVSTPPQPAEFKTAAAVVDALKAAGLPVTLTVDYDEASDPNDLMGRPGGYVDKVAFRDSRAEADPDHGIGEGGSVELFDDAADAVARAEYVRRIAKSSPLFAEYTYVAGGVVLRVSRELTPTQAREYEAALKAMA